MNSILRKFCALLAVLAFAVLAPLSASAQFADQATYIATPGGTANAITLAVDNWNINRPGVPLRFLPASQNTGATTVVVNGVGSPIAIRKQTGAGLKALTGGELTTTQIATIIYDGTVWELQSPDQQAAGAGGYLTPCQTSSPSPVAGCSAGFYLPTSTVTSATTLFYEPVQNSAAPGTVPIFNGGRFISTAVTESQMTLILSATANTANNAYDVCVYDNGGTPAIGTMPAWSSAGSGSSSRGTAAAIVTVNGIWVNNISATVTNNNVGVSVAANRCTIVASILIDGVNGQVTFHRSYGQSRRWPVWNFYNRVPIYLKAGSNTASWTYNGTSWRASNNSSANSFIYFTGLPEEPLQVSCSQTALQAASNDFFVGIGINSTTVPSGLTADSRAGSSALVITLTSFYQSPPLFGVNTVTSLENTSGATATYNGTENSFLLSGWWRG